MGWLKSLLSRAQPEASGPQPPAPRPIRPPANPTAPLEPIVLDEIVLQEIVELVVEDALAWARDEQGVCLARPTNELALDYLRAVGGRVIGGVVRRKLRLLPAAQMKADRMQES